MSNGNEQTIPNLEGMWGEWTITQMPNQTIVITAPLTTGATGKIFFEYGKWKAQVSFAQNNNNVSTAVIEENGDKLVWSDQTQWRKTKVKKQAPQQVQQPQEQEQQVQQQQTQPVQVADVQQQQQQQAVVKPVKKQRSESSNKGRGKIANVVQVCHNCKATESPSWRKDDEGNILCNKCRHGQQRPLDIRALRGKEAKQKNQPASPNVLSPATTPRSATPQQTQLGDDLTPNSTTGSAVKQNAKERFASDKRKKRKSQAKSNQKDQPSAKRSKTSHRRTASNISDTGSTSAQLQDIDGSDHMKGRESDSDSDIEENLPTDINWFEYNHPAYNRRQPPYSIYHMEEQIDAPPIYSQRANGVEDDPLYMGMERLLMRQQEMIYHQQMELLKLQELVKQRAHANTYSRPYYYTQPVTGIRPQTSSSQSQSSSTAIPDKQVVNSVTPNLTHQAASPQPKSADQPSDPAFNTKSNQIQNPQEQDLLQQPSTNMPPLSPTSIEIAIPDFNDILPIDDELVVE